MAIELPRETRDAAIASIERWFREERDEKIGNLAASSLLGFFLEEIAPSVYNRAVADVQSLWQRRVEELDLDVHEEEFQHWRKRDGGTPRGGRR